MKTIYLVRHAKSGWDNHDLADFDRPLNDRGLKSAPFMAYQLKKKEIKPVLVISSPANRAFTTAEIFCEILEYPRDQIVPRIEIYEGGTTHLLNIVQQIPDNYTTVMLFGHNPTITDFVNLLAGNHIDSMSTCSIVSVDMKIKSWEKAAADTGKIVFHEYPKKHQ